MSMMTLSCMMSVSRVWCSAVVAVAVVALAGVRAVPAPDVADVMRVPDAGRWADDVSATGLAGAVPVSGAAPVAVKME